MRLARAVPLLVVALRRTPLPPIEAFSAPRSSLRSRGENGAAPQVPNDAVGGGRGKEGGGGWLAGFLGAATSQFHVSRTLAEGTVGLSGAILANVVDGNAAAADNPKPPIETSPTIFSSSIFINEEVAVPETMPPSFAGTSATAIASMADEFIKDEMKEAAWSKEEIAIAANRIAEEERKAAGAKADAAADTMESRVAAVDTKDVKLDTAGTVVDTTVTAVDTISSAVDTTSDTKEIAMDESRAIMDILTNSQRAIMDILTNSQLAVPGVAVAVAGALVAASSALGAASEEEKRREWNPPKPVPYGLQVDTPGYGVRPASGDAEELGAAVAERSPADAVPDVLSDEAALRTMIEVGKQAKEGRFATEEEALEAAASAIAAARTSVAKDPPPSSSPPAFTAVTGDTGGAAKGGGSTYASNSSVLKGKPPGVSGNVPTKREDAPPGVGGNIPIKPRTGSNGPRASRGEEKPKEEWKFRAPTPYGLQEGTPDAEGLQKSFEANKPGGGAPDLVSLPDSFKSTSRQTKAAGISMANVMKGAAATTTGDTESSPPPTERKLDKRSTSGSVVGDLKKGPFGRSLEQKSAGKKRVDTVSMPKSFSKYATSKIASKSISTSNVMKGTGSAAPVGKKTSMDVVSMPKSFSKSATSKIASKPISMSNVMKGTGGGGAEGPATKKASVDVVSMPKSFSKSARSKFASKSISTSNVMKGTGGGGAEGPATKKASVDVVSMPKSFSKSARSKFASKSISMSNVMKGASPESKPATASETGKSSPAFAAAPGGKVAGAAGAGSIPGKKASGPPKSFAKKSYKKSPTVGAGSGFLPGLTSAVPPPPAREEVESVEGTPPLKGARPAFIAGSSASGGAVSVAPSAATPPPPAKSYAKAPSKGAGGSTSRGGGAFGIPSPKVKGSSTKSYAKSSPKGSSGGKGAPGGYVSDLKAAAFGTSKRKSSGKTASSGKKPKQPTSDSGAGAGGGFLSNLSQASADPASKKSSPPAKARAKWSPKSPAPPSKGSFLAQQQQSSPPPQVSPPIVSAQAKAATESRTVGPATPKGAETPPQPASASQNRPEQQWQKGSPIGQFGMSSGRNGKGYPDGASKGSTFGTQPGTIVSDGETKGGYPPDARVVGPDLEPPAGGEGTAGRGAGGEEGPLSVTVTDPRTGKRRTISVSNRRQ